mmetsp:Transcript_115556/g.326670  ORF Transcript_115556/g.326670 Transcript_115556/m.326670 type:complete len:194 (-) Transcript_115556:90-671(-)
MATEINVTTISGDTLCTVSLSNDQCIEDLKAEVQAQSCIPVAQQKILKRAGWDLIPLQDDDRLDDCLEDSSEVVLVHFKPYDGKYKVAVKWNGDHTVEILGDHAKVTAGTTGFEAKIEWDGRNAKFEGRRYTTTEWSRKHTSGSHKAEDGLVEKYDVMFNTDEGSGGFTGTFQREYEGTLPMSGTFMDENAES